MKTCKPTPARILRYDPAVCRDIASMDDFFKAVGLDEMILAKEIIDVGQIWMNREQCEEIEEFIYQNLRKSKKRKGWSDQYYKNASAMDWLCYSPVGIPTLRRNEIWVWRAEEAEERMEDYRNGLLP